MSPYGETRPLWINILNIQNELKDGKIFKKCPLKVLEYTDLTLCTG